MNEYEVWESKVRHELEMMFNINRVSEDKLEELYEDGATVADAVTTFALLDLSNSR